MRPHAWSSFSRLNFCSRTTCHSVEVDAGVSYFGSFAVRVPRGSRPSLAVTGKRALATTVAASDARSRLTSGDKMRAAVYHEFGGPIQVEEVPVPVAERGGVVVEVRATGVCRSDWHGWKGHDSDIAPFIPGAFTPGHELSGVIAAVGEGVSKLAVGERVAVPFILSCGSCRECARSKPTVCEDQQQPGFTLQGSFAQFVALPRADRNISRLPSAVSFSAAAALGCRFTTAYRAVIQQGRLERSEVLAVFGCGGVGLSAIMIGVAHDARVLAIDPNPATRAKAEALGASVSIDAALGDDYVRARVEEVTDGVGADVAIEAAGFVSTVENAVWCTRRAGRVVQVGLPIGTAVPPVIPMARVAGREIEIVGSHGFAAADFPAILAMVEEGRLRPHELIERGVSLEEGAAAIQAMDVDSPLGITMVTSF